jgi:outer membrane receptor protein involved in Fe transport
MRNLKRALMLSSLLAAVAPVAALAQEAPAPSDEVTDEIIVTGVNRPTTKLEAPSSVSSIPPEQVERTAPRSTAELFRGLPGIQVEPSSGDANTNLKVRGLPISSGGSRYVSFQEDGFPSLLIGDTAFATADSFIRYDRTISTVQAIRGGSASTAAQNAPGGIINMISKRGDEKGGEIAFTTGLNYESYRGDFEYGMPLNDTWSAHIGGFYRSGEGPRETNGGNVEKGYQIKANLYGDFDKGSVQLLFKRLDDKVPTYLPIPARYNGSGFDEVGVDFSDGTLFLDTTDFANRVDGVDAVEGDGFEAEVTSIGFVGEYDVLDWLNASVRHRSAFIKGNFASPFPANVFNDALAGPSVEIVYFNTQLRDFDNRYTELALTGDFDAVSLKGGVSFDKQNINANWNFNQYYRRLDGSLTPFNQGNSVNGVLYGNPAFGNCCTRDYNFEVDLISPFLALTGEYGNLSWDVSYRHNEYSVDGTFAEATVQAPQDINGDGSIGLNEQAVNDFGASRPADYDVNFDAWSAGANYRITDDIAVFANYAEGGSVGSPDRITGSFDLAGGVSNPAAWNSVNQWELGFKFSRRDMSFFVTYFNADTNEAREFEVTTQTFIQNAFEAKGVEVEGHYEHESGLGLRATATFTDSEITGSASGANIGNTPRRQAGYLFNISPYYNHDRFTIGANFFGTDSVFVQDSNSLEFGSYMVTSLNAAFDLTDRLRLSADVNNLFNKVGFTEGEEGSAAVGDFVRIRPINGRTASLSLSYRF